MPALLCGIRGYCSQLSGDDFGKCVAGSFVVRFKNPHVRDEYYSAAEPPVRSGPRIIKMLSAHRYIQ